MRNSSSGLFEYDETQNIPNFGNRQASIFQDKSYMGQ